MLERACLFLFLDRRFSEQLISVHVICKKSETSSSLMIFKILSTDKINFTPKSRFTDNPYLLFIAHKKYRVSFARKKFLIERDTRLKLIAEGFASDCGGARNEAPHS